MDFFIQECKVDHGIFHGRMGLSTVTRELVSSGPIDNQEIRGLMTGPVTLSMTGFKPVVSSVEPSYVLADELPVFRVDWFSLIGLLIVLSIALMGASL